jgi:hypothetical protein
MGKASPRRSGGWPSIAAAHHIRRPRPPLGLPAILLAPVATVLRAICAPGLLNRQDAKIRTGEEIGMNGLVLIIPVPSRHLALLLR